MQLTVLGLAPRLLAPHDDRNDKASQGILVCIVVIAPSPATSGCEKRDLLPLTAPGELQREALPSVLPVASYCFQGFPRVFRNAACKTLASKPLVLGHGGLNPLG